jgi:hypothetical protein
MISVVPVIKQTNNNRGSYSNILLHIRQDLDCRICNNKADEESRGNMIQPLHIRQGLFIVQH